MQSHQVLREAINKKGVKAMSAELKLSQAMVYKWCQPRDEEGGDGSYNPLDRVLAIVEASEDTGPVHWLCQAASGFFVENPVRTGPNLSPVLQATQKLLREFSDLLEIISDSYNDDSAINSAESQRIREEWERLKTLGEGFVRACEDGRYSNAT